MTPRPTRHQGVTVADRNIAFEKLDGEVPITVALEQNCPNPFNPTTTIEFELDQSRQVRLTMHDLLGRPVLF